VQQRAGGRQPEWAAAARGQRQQARQRHVEVGAPDVAAVDDADREHLGLGQPVGDRLQFVRGAHAVHVQAGDRQLAGHAQVFLQGEK
jgi:hypothetical protein